MKKIILINVLLIAFTLTIVAEVNSVMQPAERITIEQGGFKIFDDSINFRYQVMSSIEVAIEGDDSAYVDVTLNRWSQDTVAGYIKTNITVIISKDAPVRDLSVNMCYSYLFTNGNGKQSSRWIITTTIADIETYADNNNICIYPNPTSGKLQIKGLPQNEAVKVSVYNITGEKVLEQFNSGETATLDLSRFQRGVYLISLNGNLGKAIKINKE
jgi:hypothetical protein